MKVAEVSYIYTGTKSDADWPLCGLQTGISHLNWRWSDLLFSTTRLSKMSLLLLRGYSSILNICISVYLEKYLDVITYLIQQCDLWRTILRLHWVNSASRPVEVSMLRGLKPVYLRIDGMWLTDVINKMDRDIFTCWRQITFCTTI